MHLKLEKTYAINASVDAAWLLLCDIKSVAECMPGAQITEQLSDIHYSCRENLRVGPIHATFKGEIEIRSLDENEKKLHLIGKGSDVMGNSTTSMDLSVWVVPSSEGQCELIATADIHVSGQMANFGSRMVLPIADQIMKQFGDNFAKRLLVLPEQGIITQSDSTETKKLDVLALLWNTLKELLKNTLAQFKTKSK